MLISVPPQPHEPLYLCLEIDQFPAQAIAAYDPRYRNRPFAVVRQDADDHRCRIRACSRAAERLGVAPGMPVRHLQKRRLKLAIVPQNAELEKTACEELAGIVCNYTPEYEIDMRGTCLMDLSGTPVQRRMEIERIPLRLKGEIGYKIGLDEIAIGVSGSRLVARVLAKAARPNAVRICPPGEENAVLASLDPRLLPGLSGPCREKIGKYGLKTAGQIRQLGRDALVRRFGKEGEKLYALTGGMDASKTAVPVNALHAETVLNRDINDHGLLVQHVRDTADKLCYKLRTGEACTDRLTFLLKYTDNKTVRKTVSLSPPTNDFVTIARTAVRLYETLYQRRVAVKSMELMAGRPQRDTGQLDLFETDWERRQRRLGAVIADVRKRMGFGSVLSASSPMFRK